MSGHPSDRKSDRPKSERTKAKPCVEKEQRAWELDKGQLRRKRRGGTALEQSKHCASEESASVKVEICMKREKFHFRLCQLTLCRSALTSERAPRRDSGPCQLIFPAVTHAQLTQLSVAEDLLIGSTDPLLTRLARDLPYKAPGLGLRFEYTLAQGRTQCWQMRLQMDTGESERGLRRRITEFVFCNFAAPPRNLDRLLSISRHRIGDGASEAQPRLHSVPTFGSAACNTLLLCVGVSFRL
ncbi:LOW QUALITY PROTEIN: hypothetical protein PHBOTO_005696 [Pseudozyma hubeiensis]|nr:LOW QUALITY PROTEIN: hypothetical protein PHBOTO_005696 [Pseudozyma hubeiensis]